MSRDLQLEADLTFDIDVPAGEGHPAAHVHATVTAEGNHVRVHSDDILSLVGQPSRAAVRSMAAQLARLGLVVDVSGPDGLIVSLGAVDPSPAHRLVTRSRHMRLGSWTRAAAAARARLRPSSRATRLRGPGLPPGTPWPPLPAMAPHPYVASTTHDPAGGGHPRLYLCDTSDPLAPWPVGVFELSPDGVTIGSGEGVGLQLAGIDDLQAEIVRTDDDEYVLVARSTRMLSTVGGQQLPEQILRTGARIELGTWRMSYVRDEYADHGRPYGGRIGGELGRQRTQPIPENRRGPSF
ncbi:FHA domain-containing protein [Aeromicrobium sp. SMF47]|uniref:FHA domain-containing protein n=1 Tax=Aeromicrobium yanjiei TaxID=2662028 RepID=A0A5Q2MEA1_9ACTN|nr:MULTISPECIES: FHA domain-containing protein [Aeromicrobium]MRJ77467.1 FHA domain-containing protein [Aeromicrobium yanjiei]MRK01834.1 FHA domain-containing protein [Aeromicrobium sp. S22]QGG41424.1 FHA domain-containing protein [Aeromicrobium yanjiei]